MEFSLKYIVSTLIFDDSFASVLGWSTSAISTLAGLMYLYHWYYVNFEVLREYTYFDHKNLSKKNSVLDDIIYKSRRKEIDNVQSLLSCASSVRICVWGPDIFSCEKLVELACANAGCRVFSLDFGRAVWACNINSFIKRLNETTGPFRAFLQNVVSVISGAQTNEEAIQMTDENFEEKLAQFRIYLSEKKSNIQNIIKRDPNRPLVFYVHGLDQLIPYTGSNFSIPFTSRKIIQTYLNHFLSFGAVYPNVHVILTFSHKFWYDIWIQTPSNIQMTYSIPLSKLEDNQVVQIWSTYPFKFPMIGMKLKDVVSFWGTEPLQIMRIISAINSAELLHFDTTNLVTNKLSYLFCTPEEVKSKLSILNIKEIYKQDVQNYMFLLFSNFRSNNNTSDNNLLHYCSHTAPNNDDRGDGLTADADDSNNNNNNNSSDNRSNYMKIFQLLTSSPNGKIPFSTLFTHHPSLISSVLTLTRLDLLIISIEEGNILNQTVDDFPPMPINPLHKSLDSREHTKGSNDKFVNDIAYNSLDCVVVTVRRPFELLALKRLSDL